jgi:hypothetical protein
MYTVSSLTAQGKWPYETLLAIKSQGPPKPTFSFEGKRQCFFADQYGKHTWMCGCPE